MTPAEHITDERLAEIIKGCEGVTPGPWGEGDKWVFASPRSGNPSHALEHIFRNEEAQANAAHVARLDPQTVLSLLTELQHRRAEEAGTRVGSIVDDQYVGPFTKCSCGGTELELRGKFWCCTECGVSYGEHAGPAASPSSPASGVRVKATHRHVKRGSEYLLIGYGKMQAEKWLMRADVIADPTGVPPVPVLEREFADNAEVAIYRSVDDGTLWARPREEFEDGRFVALSALGEQP